MWLETEVNVSVLNDLNQGRLTDLSLLFMQKGSEGWVYSECRGNYSVAPLMKDQW